MRASLTSTLLFSLMLGISSAHAQSKVLAIVNGESITESDIALAVEDLQTQYPSIPPAQQAGVALEFLIEVKLAAQAAKGEKFEEGEDFKRKLAYAK